MADKTGEERPKTQAEQDYEESYTSAENYYGGPSRSGNEGVAERTYEEQAPATPGTPADPDASYDKHHYSDEELSKLGDDTHGNDEWFASGAGVSREPFERRWTGARSSGSAASQRPASGILRAGSAASDRRIILRRDLRQDPFIERLAIDERRTSSPDRRSADPSRTRKKLPAHPR